MRTARQTIAGCMVLIALSMPAQTPPASPVKPTAAKGPLRVHPKNPRYFTDGITNAGASLRAVCNEAPSAAFEWQCAMLQHLRTYEARKPKQHLILLSPDGWKPGDWSTTAEEKFIASRADCIATTGAWCDKANPKANQIQMPVFMDLDHVSPGSHDPALVWKAFTRGYHFSLYDHPFEQPQNESPAWQVVRANIRQTRRLSCRVADLARMRPRADLASTGFCLANEGQDYVVYAPRQEPIRVQGLQVGREYQCEWFDPAKGSVNRTTRTRAGASTLTLSPPCAPAVLFVKLDQSGTSGDTAVAPGDGLAAGRGADNRAPRVDSPKGKWGRVTPISDRNHPNLYYDRGEIEELRQMMLVQHSPQHLYDRYQAEVRDAVAVKTIPDNKSPHPANMKAALSYAIKPTPAKADAIRVALLSFISAFPDGLPGWYGTPGCYFSGYSVPWMFDLLLAYHPDKLTSSEKTTLKAWFRKSAQNLRFDTRNPGAPSQSGRDVVPPVTREGKTMVSFPNWFSRYMGPSLACALVSGDQAAVDYWADSGWPHELLTFDGVTDAYPSDAANRYDLVMYLLAVYPSGANTDTYTREGYRLPQSDWYTTDYTSGGYHFAQMSGAVLGAEMAYHNGMTGVFTLTGQGTEPALLRHWKRAIQSRTEIDRRPGNKVGHPIIGHSQELWAGYRRYADPTIQGAVSSLADSKTDEQELPSAVWEFFGYPRRIVWPAKQKQQ